LLVERYTQEHGDYPQALGLSVWGTATMRTGGDDIAQAFALLGVRHHGRMAAGGERFEVLPMPCWAARVDVTLRFPDFGDAFTNVIRLFDAAVQKVASLEDEDAWTNPIRARVLQEAAELQAQGLSEEVARHQAGLRVFGAKPGSYGAGLQGLIDGRNRDSDEDLATAYRNWEPMPMGKRTTGPRCPSALCSA
jgi:cobaltochelatase CobN